MNRAALSQPDAKNVVSMGDPTKLGFGEDFKELGGSNRLEIDYLCALENRCTRRNRPHPSDSQLLGMVGAERFELPTLCSQSRFSSLLRSVKIKWPATGLD